MREICFDTETTGLKTEEGDRIIEIGCVELIDRVETENYFHVYLNPDMDVSEESTRITGLTNDFLADKPKFKDVIDDFLNFIKNDVLIAHNSNFDMKFLNNEMSLINREEIQNDVIDSLALAKKKFPGQKNNLDALCKRFNIDNSKRTLHGALLDAELLAEVYIELTGGSQKTFDTSVASNKTNEMKNISIDELMDIINKKDLKKSRDFTISQDELMIHKEFIEKKIKNSIWEN